MTEIEQTAEELRQLREKQALHRRQLEENRQKALDKKKQTRVQTGRVRMRYWIIWKNICRFPGNRHRKPASLQKKRRALTLLF